MPYFRDRTIYTDDPVMKLDLTPSERSKLRKLKIRIADVPNYDAAFLAEHLEVPLSRAEELHGLATFQSINSLGPKFARDLLDMGYSSLAALRDRSGAELLDAYEKLIGYQTDPCVEDQFRRVVHYANTEDNGPSWFDFTAERKAYREVHGYPADRPRKHWTEVYYT